MVMVVVHSEVSQNEAGSIYIDVDWCWNYCNQTNLNADIPNNRVLMAAGTSPSPSPGPLTPLEGLHPQ